MASTATVPESISIPNSERPNSEKDWYYKLIWRYIGFLFGFIIMIIVAIAAYFSTAILFAGNNAIQYLATLIVPLLTVYYFGEVYERMIGCK